MSGFPYSVLCVRGEGEWGEQIALWLGGNVVAGTPAVTESKTSWPLKKKKKNLDAMVWGSRHPVRMLELGYDHHIHTLVKE